MMYFLEHIAWDTFLFSLICFIQALFYLLSPRTVYYLRGLFWDLPDPPESTLSRIRTFGKIALVIGLIFLIIGLFNISFDDIIAGYFDLFYGNPYPGGHTIFK